MSVRDRFLINIAPTGRPIFIGGAASDINNRENPELQGDKILDETIPGDKIVEKALGSKQLREIGGYLVGNSTLKAGSTVLEAILLGTQKLRETIELDGGFIYDIEALDTAFAALKGESSRVGNIINKFQVDGKNSWQLLYDGTGYFAGGKFSWGFDGTEFQVLIEGEVIATSGKLVNLDIDGTLTIATDGLITNQNFDFLIDKEGLRLNRSAVFQNRERSISFNTDVGIASYIYSVQMPGNNTNFYIDSLVPMVLRSTGGTRIEGNAPDNQSIGITSLGISIDNIRNTPIFTPDFIWAESGVVRIASDNLGDPLNLIYNDDDATSSSTGALRVLGGIGVGGNSWFDGTVRVANASADNHAINRITGDGRYLRQSNIIASGPAVVVQNETLEITLNGSTYRIAVELI